MWQTIGGMLAAIIALLMAGIGLLALVWLLWKLWGHREEEPVQPTRGAGFTAAPAEPVPAGRVVAEPDVEVRPPAIELGLEAPDVAAEPAVAGPEVGEAAPAAMAAAVEEPVRELPAPTAEAETRAPTIPVPPLPAAPDDLT